MIDIGYTFLNNRSQEETMSVTKDQNIDLQVDALTNAGCETVFQEVASVQKTARPVLSDMLSRLHELRKPDAPEP